MKTPQVVKRLPWILAILNVVVTVVVVFVPSILWPKTGGMSPILIYILDFPPSLISKFLVDLVPLNVYLVAPNAFECIGLLPIGCLWFLTIGVGVRALIVKVGGYSRSQPQPACDRCGYDLTGNVSGVCPECGTAIPTSTGAKA